MRALLGFKRIDEKKKVRLARKLIYDNYITTLGEYIKIQADRYKGGLSYERECDGVTFSLIAGAVKATMYYRGIINFCKKHLYEELLEFIPDANEIERYILENFEDEDSEIPGIINELDTYFTSSLNDMSYDENEAYLGRTMTKMLTVLAYNNLPEYKPLKALLRKGALQ
jgi:hypothetical protein